MQSRLVSSSTPLTRLLFSSNKSQWPRFTSASTGRTADHAGRLDDDEAAEAEKSALAEYKPSKEKTETLVSPKLPHASSPRLENSGVNKPVEAPTIQQKRHKSDANIADEVSCTALDESPWPEEGDMEKQRGEQEEDDKEYFEHNKASPLSMIEVEDTRKPVTQATDSGFADYGGEGMVWRPEQIDTAEEALMRAARIWKERAMSGDPDFPPSRILRELRGHDL